MNVVLRFDRRRADRLRAALEAAGFRFENRANALFLAKGPGVTATAYASGKLLLTGKNAPDLARRLADEGAEGVPLTRAEPRKEPPFRPRIGTDEAGKGDWFGPLVVAAVHVPDAAAETMLREKRVRDAKELADDETLLLGRWLATRVPNRVVTLPPPEYNARYAVMQNLNHLLAWAHARAIRDLLPEAEATEVVVVDQFANETVLKRALGPDGLPVPVEQFPRAESRDRAVAAASVLARAEFLRSLRALSAGWDMNLPKGGGAPTLTAGRAFVARHGADALGEVAKLHFVNTESVLGSR